MDTENNLVEQLTNGTTCGKLEKVARFFDERADTWDASSHVGKSRAQGAVVSLVGVKPGDRVLDLGCGTGVMVPYYIEAGAGSVLGVDLSEKMVENARKNFADDPAVDFVASDALELDETNQFDEVVIYNAYPHFVDKSALAKKVHRLLKPGGRFAVAHGSGKDEINSHHQAHAAGVSSGLGPVREESAVWEGLFQLESLVDTPGFYAFSGVRL